MGLEKHRRPRAGSLPEASALLSGLLSDVPPEHLQLSQTISCLCIISLPVNSHPCFCGSKRHRSVSLKVRASLSLARGQGAGESAAPCPAQPSSLILRECWFSGQSGILLQKYLNRSSQGTTQTCPWEKREEAVLRWGHGEKWRLLWQPMEDKKIK